MKTIKEKAKVSVLIPTYNEKENILKLIKTINNVLKKNKISGQIIIVDDNSPDKTGEIAGKFADKHPFYNLRVIHRTKNRGYGNSILEGFKYVLKPENKDKDAVVITMDADFSHNPLEIPKMTEEIKKGADVVIGSRRIEKGKIIGWNLWRHFCSFSAGKFSKILLGLKTRDVTSGFRAYKTEVIRKMPLDKIKSNGYSFLEELLFYAEKNKFRIKEIPIIFFDRKKGKSKLSKKEIIRFFITILRLKIRLMLKENNFLRFLLVGIIGIFVNMFFLWFFKENLKLILWLSGALAIELSVITNFFLNNFWTFRSRNLTSSISSRFVKYQISVMLGIIINYVILILLTKAGVFYLLSNLIGIFFGTISNYILSSRWAWRKNER